MADISGSENFRARGNYIIGTSIEIFCAIYIWASFTEGGVRNILTSFLVSVVLSSLNYIGFLRPCVIFTIDGIEVLNPISRDFINWADVQEIDARWCMSINTSTQTINVYGAPAPGRHRSRNVHESEMRGIKGGETGFLRPARSPKSDSGAAVHIAEIWRQKYLTSGKISARATLHTKEVQPLIVAGIATISAILINIFH